jgi:hypothetical protein
MTRREYLSAWAAAPLRRAAYRPPAAFYYQGGFPASAVQWYRRFGLVVLGAFLPPARVAPLRATGARLLAYEWTPAFYPGDPLSASEDWEQAVRRNAARWLISPEPSGGGAAAAGRTACWYDFGNDELLDARAAHLARRLRDLEYQGLFFDTPGAEQLPGAVLQLFRERHPDLDYNARQGEFLRRLRAGAGSAVFFTNQGYRQPAHLLTYADYDLSESYFTYLEGAGFAFRPWHDPQRPWESIRTPLTQLVLPALRAYPRVRMIHANYAQGPAAGIARAARYSWAAARVFGHDSYLIVPPGRPDLESHEIYFRDLGRPRAGSWREDEGAGAAWREYDRGTVVLNSGRTPFTLPGSKIRVPPGPDGFVLP